MKWLRACLVLATYLEVISGSGNRTSPLSLIPRMGNRIIAGVAVKIDDYPFQLSLRSSGNHICGASIISSLWALTAAHCTQGTVSLMTVRSGSSDRTAGGIVHQIIKKIDHAQYSGSTFDNDISLLQIDSTNPLPATSAVTLPFQGQRVPAGMQVTISGWGDNFPFIGQSPQYLQSVTIPVVTPQRCSFMYSLTSTITERMLCTNYIFGVLGSCQGDSGGPLTAWIGGVKQQVGIVSFGKPFCTLPLVPTVYTRVPAYRNWIRENSGV